MHIDFQIKDQTEWSCTRTTYVHFTQIHLNIYNNVCVYVVRCDVYNSLLIEFRRSCASIVLHILQDDKSFYVRAFGNLG